MQINSALLVFFCCSAATASLALENKSPLFFAFIHSCLRIAQSSRSQCRSVIPHVETWHVFSVFRRVPFNQYSVGNSTVMVIASIRIHHPRNMLRLADCHPHHLAEFLSDSRLVVPQMSRLRESLLVPARSIRLRHDCRALLLRCDRHPLLCVVMMYVLGVCCSRLTPVCCRIG